MKVKCIKNKKEIFDKDIGNYKWLPNLSINRLYYVISIEYDNYRIYGDENKNNFIGPCLYPKELFVIVNENIEKEWIKTIDDNGDISYFGPKEFSNYFWEKYHDMKISEQRKIIEKFKSLIFGK